jgi:broad specificity phosphatase PhoE
MAFQTTIEIFRHEERMDSVDEEKKNVDIPHDTPLSTTGCVNAFVAADGVEASTLTISSPLKRCVQTAKPFLKGTALVVDARFMEVYHNRVIGPLADFTLRTDEELGIPFLIRTRHGLPAEEESRGIGGTSDQRYREAIYDVASKAQKAGIKHVRIFTHGDCLGSFAAILGKEIYEVNFGASITATFNGTWTYVGNKGVGIMGV